MNKRTSLFNQIVRFILVFLIVLAMQGAMPPQPAQAYTFLVTNTNDSGSGSLRQAVLDASGVTTETIGFDPSLDGATITLSSEISITKDLKIQGLSNTNQRIQISGNNSTRVFSIASGADVWINSLDIVDGNDVFGAGIANSGELLITDCAFDGNLATDVGGAIYNDGDLTLTNCTVSNNSAGLDGGAMYTSGASARLRVQKSTFTGNHADRDGGGLYYGVGTVNYIQNSTFYDNTASQYGGGALNGGFLAVYNGTFSDNSATTSGGGIRNVTGGTLVLQNSILANSLGGGDCLIFGGTLSPTSTNYLVEDGGCSAPVTGDPALGSLTSNGGPTETMALGTGSPAIDAGDDGTCESADQRGVARPHGSHCDIGAYEYASGLVVNTNLDLPGDGVCTSMNCTLREAIAVAASGDTITFDPALAGGVITLGSRLVITKDLTIDGSGLDPNVSVSGDSSVQVMKVSGAMVSIDHLNFVDGVASIGGGIENFDSTLTLSNCKFDTNSAGAGGAINNNNATLNVTDCTFYNNSATEYGGAINSLQGTVTVTSSTFEENRSDQYGGAIFNNESTMTITNSTFYLNDALEYSGGIANWLSTLTLSNSTLSDNFALLGAGGISNSPGSTLYITNTIVANSSVGGDCLNSGTIATNTNNLIEDGSCTPAVTGDPLLGTLAYHGGPTETMALGTGSSAIDAGDDPACEPTDQRGAGRWSGAHCDIGAFEYPSLLEVNSVADPGDGTCNASECTLREAITIAANGDTITFDPFIPGGVITLGSRLEITKDLTIDGSNVDPNVQVSGDESVQVMKVSGGTVSIDHLDFVDGVASIGGGIENYDSTLALSNCKFDTNSANDGGAINNNNATLTVTDCTFYNNSAVDYGGAINNYQGTVTVTGSTFEENRSDGFGGGIYNTGGTMTVANSTLFYNDALTAGGGIASWTGTLTILNSTLSANYSPAGGGLFNGSSSTLVMKNTIIADSSTGGDCVNSGAFSTNTNNLIEDNTCTPTISGDPILAPLADNGGATETMGLRIGSPAIDAGNNSSCETTDQRGVSRPVGAHCDIGAFEGELPYTIFLPLIMR